MDPLLSESNEKHFLSHIAFSEKNIASLEKVVNSIEDDLKSNPNDNLFWDKLNWWEDAVKLTYGFLKIPAEIKPKIKILFRIRKPDKYIMWISQKYVEDLDVFTKLFEDISIKDSDIYFKFKTNSIHEILKTRLNK